MPDISVIIPTRNRAAFLKKCLASLCEQTLARARYEICVVDNASTDATPKIVDEINALYPAHKVFRIEEPRLGVTISRNTGIARTSSGFIAHGDDDATVPPDWLERFMADMQKLGPEVGKVAGEIVPVWGAPRPAWLTDGMLPLMSASSGFGDKPRFVDEGLLEGNSCYRREALIKAGGFPSMLGHKGDSLLSADNAVDLVMLMMGWKLYHDPSIVMHHTIHADRLTPSWIRRRYFWQGVSNYAVLHYLQSKGINSRSAMGVDMPFDPCDWSFINNADDPPTEAHLKRLLGLGFVLASSGFIQAAS